MRTRKLLAFASTITSILLLASCSEQKAWQDGTVSPLGGKYPLRLSANVEQVQSRSTGKEAWTGGEEIGVILESQTGKYYITDASGNVEAIDESNTLYWPHTAKTNIKAWYPFDTPTLLDISDQSAGYAAFDILSAQTRGSFNQPVYLNFSHSMSKIAYTLTAADGITEIELNSATVTLLGDAEARIDAGIVAPADQTDGEIKPFHDVTAKQGEALVVPQNMKGKPLLKVSIGNNTFVYTPETDEEGNLMAGNCHTYAVTVKAAGLEVQRVASNDWGNGGEEKIFSITATKYTANEVKAGDYIYSDGTTSDGGLRARYPYGKGVRVANPKPKPLANKTVVGIVFWTPKDTNPKGRTTPASLTDDKIMAADFPNCTHGLAVSLKDIPTGEKWINMPSYSLTNEFQNREQFTHPRKSDFVSVASGLGPTDPINRILGYQNTQVILAFNALCRSNNEMELAAQPVDDIANFSKSNPAPKNSTGWFFPSVKELHILCYKDVDNVYLSYNYTFTENRDLVNASLLAAGGEVFYNSQYWSSSEYASYVNGVDYSKYEVIIVDFNRAFPYSTRKTNSARVRAVCAF